MLNNLTQRCERLPRMMERGCESERHAIIATSDGVAMRHTIETDTYLLMVAHREVVNDDCLFQLLSWLLFHDDHVADEIGGGCEVQFLKQIHLGHLKNCTIEK